MHKQIEKQTYPPMYAPKPNHKFGTGFTANDTHQIKSHSPMPTNRTYSNNFQNMNTFTHVNYKPISQPSSNSQFYNGIPQMNQKP